MDRIELPQQVRPDLASARAATRGTIAMINVITEMMMINVIIETMIINVIIEVFDAGVLPGRDERRHRCGRGVLAAGLLDYVSWPPGR